MCTSLPPRPAGCIRSCDTLGSFLIGPVHLTTRILPHNHPQDNGQHHDGERSQQQQHLQACHQSRPSTDQQLQQQQQLQQLRSGELRNANGAGGGGAGLLSTAGSSNCEALLQLLPVLTGLDGGWWDQVERACVAIAQHLGAAHTWCVGPGGAGGAGGGQQTVRVRVGQRAVGCWEYDGA